MTFVYLFALSVVIPSIIPRVVPAADVPKTIVVVSVTSAETPWIAYAKRVAAETDATTQRIRSKREAEIALVKARVEAEAGVVRAEGKKATAIRHAEGDNGGGKVVGDE